LLAFSRKQVSVPRVLDLNEVVRQIEKMLHRIIGEDVQLHLRLADGLPPVKVDPNQIDQMIMNLAVNSRDAMPDGGQLTLETAPVSWSSEYGDTHPNLRPGNYVMLAVSDSGYGMDAQTRSRLFEPFFTTKEKGKGTGLGLAIVYGIVKQNGGDILVYSEPGQGTVFKVYFPTAAEVSGGVPVDVAEAADVPTHSVEAPSPDAPAPTILLVEDELQVRRLTSAMLSRLGFQVMEAGSASEALELLDHNSTPISLLLADVVMPGMSGPELARKVSSLRPGMAVLFMSGYTGGGVLGQGLLDPGTPFIQKPFTFKSLADQIRHALNPLEA
jgi:two-component system, cell cycle sensor histidine kinase and response regulator CckA